MFGDILSRKYLLLEYSWLARLPTAATLASQFLQATDQKTGY